MPSRESGQADPVLANTKQVCGCSGAVLASLLPAPQAGKALGQTALPHGEGQAGSGLSPRPMLLHAGPERARAGFPAELRGPAGTAFPAAGQLPSAAEAPVSQPAWGLTPLALHQRRPGSLSFSPGCVPRIRTPEGMRSPVPGCWDAQLPACGRDGSWLCRAKLPRLFLGLVAELRLCSARVALPAQGLKLRPALAALLQRRTGMLSTQQLQGGRGGRQAGLEPRAGLLPSGERGEEDVAPGPACSKKSNLGRDPWCRGLLVAQTLLCIAAGSRHSWSLKLSGRGERA